MTETPQLTALQLCQVLFDRAALDWKKVLRKTYYPTAQEQTWFDAWYNANGADRRAWELWIKAEPI